LQQELFDSYKKYQVAVEMRYSSIKEIEGKKMEEISKIEVELQENKRKITEI
jgi:hypothetical protein